MLKINKPFIIGEIGINHNKEILIWPKEMLKQNLIYYSEKEISI